MKLLPSIAVRSESSLAKNAGLAVNERGGIIVDDFMRTSDFVTKQKTLIPLAGPANKQGRIVADNICDIKSTYAGTQGSAILKVFDLTVATTGINEKTAQHLNLSYEKSFTYSANDAAYYPHAVNMSIKTLFEKPSGKILGMQIVGSDGVDKRW